MYSCAIYSCGMLLKHTNIECGREAIHHVAACRPCSVAPWQVDPSGVSKALEKDDHEACLLGALIKSGNWLIPALQHQRLDIWLEPALPLPTLRTRWVCATKCWLLLLAAYWQ